MKIKLNIYITDEARFLRNPEENNYTADPSRHMDNTWTFVQEVEVDLANVDITKMIASVSTEIDVKVSALHTAIQVLETRKSELLALPSPS
jgi:hypothetical protein